MTTQINGKSGTQASLQNKCLYTTKRSYRKVIREIIKENTMEYEVDSGTYPTNNNEVIDSKQLEINEISKMLSATKTNDTRRLRNLAIKLNKIAGMELLFTNIEHCLKYNEGITDSMREGTNYAIGVVRKHAIANGYEVESHD